MEGAFGGPKTKLKIYDPSSKAEKLWMVRERLDGKLNEPNRAKVFSPSSPLGAMVLFLKLFAVFERDIATLFTCKDGQSSLSSNHVCSPFSRLIDPLINFSRSKTICFLCHVRQFVAMPKTMTRLGATTAACQNRKCIVDKIWQGLVHSFLCPLKGNAFDSSTQSQWMSCKQGSTSLQIG